LTSTILILGASISGLTGSIGLLGLAIPKITAGLVAMGVSISAVMPWLIAIGAVVVGAAAAYDKMTAGLKKSIEEDNKFSDSLSGLTKHLVGLREPIEGDTAALEAMKKKMIDANKAIADMEKTISDTIKENADKQVTFNENKAQIFVDQENGIAEIQKQIADKTIEINKAKHDKTSSDSVASLESELEDLKISLFAQQQALENNKQYQTGIEAEMIEMRRRASLTEFERKLEDLMRNRLADLQAYKEKLAGQLQELADLKAHKAALLVEEAKYTAGLAANNQAQLKDVQDTTAKILASLAQRASAQTSIPTIGSAVGGLVGNVISSFQFPHFAEGGFVDRPTLAVVGESEPEIIIPASKVGVGGITININGGTYLSQDAARELGDLIINQLRLQLKF
jgi:hypothetical protein